MPPMTLISRWGLPSVIVAQDPEREDSSARATCDKRRGSEEDDDDSETTGKTLWDCAKVLYDFLANPGASGEFSVKGKRVIELGAGTGALSVGLARAGAAAVTCTDLPCHLARIRATVGANATSDAIFNRCTRNPSSSISTSSSSDGSKVISKGEGLDVGVASEVIQRKACEADGGEKCIVEVAPLRWGGDLPGLLDGEADDDATAETQHRFRSIVQKSMPTINSGNDGSGSDVLTRITETGAGTKGGGEDGQELSRQDARRSPRASGDSGSDDDAVVSGDGVDVRSRCFDMIVLSEVLYWPALDLLQEDTREPLHRTLLALSEPGTRVFLVYKERWPDRENEFLEMCSQNFKIETIPPSVLHLPSVTSEQPGSEAIRAVSMLRDPMAGTAISG